MKPDENLLRAYTRGQELKEKTYEQIIYGELIPDSYMFNPLLNLFFECGYRGAPMPHWVTGWRYGEIPASGRSTNYRDQKAEWGVSIMAIDGDETRPADAISTMFIAAQDRPVVRVGGWLNPLTTGSDGEPLILGAVTLSETNQ